MEDDLLYRSDEAYTYGSKLLFLFERESLDESFFHIPFTEYKKAKNYVSFAFSDQMYTPEDIETSELIETDRPYAGYIYVESALYQVTQQTLSSLAFEIGVIGEASHMDDLQKSIHKATGSDEPQGWKNQLSNELALQLKYNYKNYIPLEKVFSLESVIIPEFGVDFGNVSTRVYTGALLRYGWGIPKDFGSFTINNSTYSQIPLSSNIKASQWRFCFNFGAKVNAIARDIFLDGNTVVSSHSVEKKNFTFNLLYGLSVHYQSFSFDWAHQYTTKEFVGQDKAHLYTSFQFSYNY